MKYNDNNYYTSNTSNAHYYEDKATGYGPIDLVFFMFR